MNNPEPTDQNGGSLFIFSKLKFSMLRNAVKGQLGQTLFGAVARALGLSSQLLVLVLMARVLPKSTLGDVMVAFTLYRLISYGLGSGLGSIILYHVARRTDDRSLDLRLMRSVTLVTALIAGSASAGCMIYSENIADLFGKPDMAKWLFSMGPMLLFGSLIQLTASSLDARLQVTRSIMLTEVSPNLIRMGGMILIAVVGLPQIFIGHLFWVAAAAPWLVDAIRMFNPKLPGFERLTLWDMRYAWWLTVYPITGMQLQGIDMLVVGALFNSSQAAEYSIASRLASLYPFLQQMVVRMFTPRSGPLFYKNDVSEINKQFAELRTISFFTTAVMTAAILVASPVIVFLIGDYNSVYALLVLFALPPLFRSAFVGIEVSLKMRGQAGVMAINSVATLLVIVIGTWGLSPSLGVNALPLTMLTSAIVILSLTAIFIGRSGIRVFGWEQASLIGATGVVLASSLFVLPPPWAAVTSGTCLAIAAAIGGRGLLSTSKLEQPHGK